MAVRTGLSWRDLPANFGNWNSVFRWLRRWAKAGVFERIFKEISGTHDFECAMIGGTIVQAHPKASGAKGGSQNHAIWRLHGGLTTKIVALLDALGNLANFILLPGRAKGLKGADPLIYGAAFNALLADKAFNADWLRT
jgi:transposase